MVCERVCVLQEVRGKLNCSEGDRERVIGKLNRWIAIAKKKRKGCEEESNPSVNVAYDGEAKGKKSRRT